MSSPNSRLVRISLTLSNRSTTRSNLPKNVRAFFAFIRLHSQLGCFSAFIAYQYYLHVVPTTYIAPRSPPLQTNQYSVTHYKRSLPDHQGTPGIFFKFDLDPMVITIHQRTTSLVQLLIR